MFHNVDAFSIISKSNSDSIDDVDECETDRQCVR